MTKKMRSLFVLAAAVCLSSTLCLADGGDAIYKAKCASCHGAAGTPSAGMAKMMGIKAASDPDMAKLSADQVGAAVKNGKGKMKAIALSDGDIKAVSAYFKTLK